METVTNLPKLREEYTLFALETQSDTPIFENDKLDLDAETLDIIFNWIIYTIKNFPDLVAIDCSVDRTRDNAPVSIFVTIAGIKVGEIYNWEHSFSECLQLLVDRKEIVLGERDGIAT